MAKERLDDICRLVTTDLSQYHEEIPDSLVRDVWKIPDDLSGKEGWISDN